VVFRALHRGNTCTVKLPSDRPPSSTQARSFEQDVLLLARLSRAGLPRVIQVDSTDVTPYAIMDVGHGQPLPRALERLAAESQLVQLALTLTSCLRELHEAGFVHGCLTAEHVLISKDGTVVSLLDKGSVSRPVPFDARDDTQALGLIMQEIASRLDRDGEARPVVAKLADELGAAQRGELASVVHELERLVNASTTARRSYPPPSPDHLPTASQLPTARQARAEFGQLRRLWEQSSEHGGKVVQVSGPAGSGKTRLLGRFAEQLGEAGVQVLSVKCRDSDWAPFSALKRMLEGHLAGLLHVSPERREEIEALLRSAAGPLASHIRLLSPRLAELFRDAPTTLQEGVAQQVFVAGIADFLAKYLESGAPSVLLFDDLQWLDASSRMVLTLLAVRICPQGHLLVCGARDDLESREAIERFRATIAPELIECVDLQPLRERDAKELISEYLGLDGAPSKELVAQLTRLCDGTPLSLLELLELTLEQGFLRPHCGTWRLDAAAVQQMRLPVSSQALIERRISLLSETTIEVLRAAAVLRNHIDPTLVARVTGQPLEEVRAALDCTLAARLLELDQHGSHKFVHDCVWEVMLRRVPISELRALHERVATALYTEGGEGAEFDYELARHHAAGQLELHPTRAFEAMRRAARRALEACDDALALSFLKPAELAAKLAAIEPERTFYVDLAETSLRTGSIAESLNYFARALERSQPGFQRAHVLGRISWVHHFESNAQGCWKAIQAALLECGQPVPTDDPRTLVSALGGWLSGRSPERGPPLSQRDAETICELYASCTRVATESGHPARALCSVLLLAAAARRLEPCRTLVHADLLTAFALSTFRAEPLWRARYARAYDMARKLGDPIALTLCHQIHYVILGWLGDLDECDRQARLCVEERGHWMELGELCHVCFAMYAAEIGRGRPLVALTWAQRAIDRVQQRGRAPAVFALIEEAACSSLSSLGREQEAVRLRRRLQRVERADIMQQGYFHLLSFQSRIQRSVEAGEVGDSLEQLIDEWNRQQLEPGSAHLLVAISYIQIAHARVHQCLRASAPERMGLLPKLGRALRDLQRARRVPVMAAHVQFTRAAYHFFRGDVRESENLLVEAERLAQDHGCVWVSFAVARLRAHMLRARGRDQAARDQAAAAELIARQYGQVFHLRCIRDEFELSSPVREPTRSEVDAPRVRRHLEALLQMSAANSRELSPERQASFILDQLLEFLSAERAFLFTRSESDGALVPHAARRLGGEDIDGAAEYDHALVEQVYATGQAVLTESVDAPDRDRMCIVVALVLREQVVGVLYLDRPDAAGIFSAEDSSLLQALANQVPVALELADALRERERLQQNLRQAQKMEAIGRLAGGIAHDFNNVLATIEFAAGSLAMNTPEGNKGRDDVNEIRDAARRGANLTRQLLMFSRGKSVLPRKIELAEVVRALSGMLHRLVRSDVRLILDITDQPLPTMADPSQIERVLMNLCKNASDAMPNGGEIRIQLRVHGPNSGSAPIGLAPEVSYAAIEVADTGTGMTEEVRTRLFEPFFTTKGSQGTGLGLANVYAIVQQCAGYVDVTSEPGNGSMFRIYLPLVKRSSQNPARFTIPPPAMVPARQPTLLVVDDDDAVRRQTARMLERAGYAVCMAQDGEDALRVLGDRMNSLEIAVTDVHMPLMDGAQLASVLRAQNPRLKVLFVSGEGPDDLLRRGLLDGDSAFLPKPFKPEILLAHVQALLREPANASVRNIVS
jgi:signal transduction histidine kinase/ActR/RegA family two-component response regulator